MKFDKQFLKLNKCRKFEEFLIFRLGFSFNLNNLSGNMAIRKRYKHGDIIQINLRPFLELYGYGQYIDYHKENIMVSCSELFYAYNFFTEKPIKSLNEISNKDLLTNPIKLFGRKKLPEDWNVLSNEKIPNNLIRTFYRKSSPHDEIGFTDNNKLFWFAVPDTNVTIDKFPMDYNSVKHLENNNELGNDLVKYRLIIEYSKLNNVDLKIQDYKDVWEGDYLDEIFEGKIKPDQINNEKLWFYETYIYCYDIPPFKDIPAEHRFVPIGMDRNTINKLLV